jgi:hypothetical protein
LRTSPNLEARAEKIIVMRAHQLHELDTMMQNCFEVLRADVEGLIPKCATDSLKLKAVWLCFLRAGGNIMGT